MEDKSSLSAADKDRLKMTENLACFDAVILGLTFDSRLVLSLSCDIDATEGSWRYLLRAMTVTSAGTTTW
jgi:hypothetical protein